MAGGLGFAGKKMISLASDAAEVDSKFKVVFGKTVPKMKENLDAFSRATGASRFELRKQAADMGALLKPLTGSTKAAGDMSTAAVKLATDLGSFNNVPTADALESIRSGLVGEAEPMRKFGVLINEAAVKAEAYASGITKVGAELTEQEKVQARYNLIMKQTKLAHGDATRTADSAANQFKRLKNMLTDTATEAGATLVPAFTKVVEGLNAAIPWLKEMGSELADRLTPHMKAFAAHVQEAWPQIKTALQGVWDFVERFVWPVFKKLGEIAGAAIREIARVLAEHGPEIKRIFQTLGQVIEAVGKVAIPILRFALVDVLPKAIGIAITAIDTIITALRGIGTGIATVVGWFRDMPGNIAKAITAGLGLVKNAITGLFGKVIGWVKDVLGIGSPSKIFYEIGKNVIQGFIGGVGSMAGVLASAVKKMVTGFAGDIIGRAGGAISGAAGAVFPSQQVSGNLVAIGRRLQGLGFQVGEHPSFGGVSPVHAKNSFHYRGRAIDVNWAGGGAMELRKLQGIYGSLAAVPHAELMIEDAGQQNQHLHFAMAKGGIVTRPTLALIGEAGPEAVIPLPPSFSRSHPILSDRDIFTSSSQYQEAGSRLGDSLLRGYYNSVRPESLATPIRDAKARADAFIETTGVQNMLGAGALLGDSLRRGFEGVSVLSGIDRTSLVGASPTTALPVHGGVIEVHSHTYLDGKQITETVRREQIKINTRNGYPQPI